jgi:pimeloyl-ACP methyl ester carboxylesterase
VNAWWLADAALLAYAAPEDAQPRWARAGFTATTLSADTTQCHVAEREDAVIVSFRGTRVVKAEGDPTAWDLWKELQGVVGDLRADAELGLVPASPGSDRLVHSGFKRALDAVWEALAGTLHTLRAARPERRVWFAGHSLGGALATLAADRWPGAHGLVTFGSPLVGEETFARTFAIPAWRFVYGRDVVSRIPEVGLRRPPLHGLARYRAVGEMRRLGPQRRPGFWARARHALPNLLAGRPWALAPDDLNDHAPIYYAIGAWNRYAG